MSVAEILHEIEALPESERAALIQELVEQNPLSSEVIPEITETERAALSEGLARRPALGAELGQIIDRMKAGFSLELGEVQALRRRLQEQGR
ncbi:MAG TPA: hypothetical protein VHY09_06480 [Candidatus Methylacidiphilales bacterium]|nr:hypothetical protein [Candidatus Methylacidiphilales bacterium]